MGVVIETFIWEPSSSFFIFFFVSTFLSISLFPYLAKNRTFGSFDHSISSSFARFQRWFLAIYTLSSGTSLDFFSWVYRFLSVSMVLSISGFESFQLLPFLVYQNGSFATI
jgi:hypothetical protein